MHVFKTLDFFGLIRLIRDIILTKIFFPNCRIIRHPVYIRGRRFMNFGSGLTTGVNLRMDAFPEQPGMEGKVLKIGKNVEINDYVHIAAVKEVVIGDHVLIASKVFITDHNHGGYTGEKQSHPMEHPRDRKLIARPIHIEENVWLGEYVTVLGGVTIGKGSVIGALSVVTGNIPPYTIAVGIPAKVIKIYNEEKGVWEKI